MLYRIALFGEAQRGPLHAPMFLHSLEELLEQVGTPPQESLGVSFAVQALLCKRDLLYFRVEEEGFSKEDYLIGLHLLLQKKEKLSAIGLPGVGDEEIFLAALPICEQNKAILLTTEKDFYDYLTSY
jgi:hypothetical protein